MSDRTEKAAEAAWQAGGSAIDWDVLAPRHQETMRRQIEAACPHIEAEVREAEVEPLRQALREIASCERHAPGDVVDIARAALSNKEASDD